MVGSEFISQNPLLIVKGDEKDLVPVLTKRSIYLYCYIIYCYRVIFPAGFGFIGTMLEEQLTLICVIFIPCHPNTSLCAPNRIITTGFVVTCS